MRSAIHWEKLFAQPEPMRMKDTQRRMTGRTRFGPNFLSAIFEGGPPSAYVMTKSAMLGDITRTEHGQADVPLRARHAKVLLGAAG